MMTFEVKVFDTVKEFEDYLNHKQIGLEKIDICFSGHQILVTVQTGATLSKQDILSENKFNTLGAILSNKDVFGSKNGTREIQFFNKDGIEIYPNDIHNIDFNTPVLRKHEIEDGFWRIVLDTSCIGRLMHGTC